MQPPKRGGAPVAFFSPACMVDRDTLALKRD